MTMSEQTPNYTTIVQLAWEPDGLYYVARHPEIENCFSDGETVEEALANLEEVTQLTLEHLREHHLPIPPVKPLGANPRELGRHQASPMDGKRRVSPELLVLPIPA